jgi:hypothetical protein
MEIGMQLPKDGITAGEGGEAGRTTRAVLSGAAQRALAEVEERRRRAAAAPVMPREVNGRRDGPEPVRYGDWEVKGIATDF